MNFRLFMMGCLTTLVAAGAFAADGIWTNNRSGNWSDAVNWKNGIVANEADYTAFFTNDINAVRTVTNNTLRTIGHLEFSDGGFNSWTWLLGGGSALTLSAGSGTSEVRWLTSTEIITPLAGTGVMLFAGSVAGAFGVTTPIMLTLKGTNTFTGPVVLRKGVMNAFGNTPSGANGTMGNATNAIQVGDSETAGSDLLQFFMDGDTATFARPLVVNNAGGAVIIGNIANGGFTMTWSGDITLNRDVWLSGHASVMRMPGRITGTGGITKTDSSVNNASVVLQGSNDFSGGVSVNRGTLVVAHPQALGTGTSAIRLGDAFTTNCDVWLRITNAISLGRDVLVSSNGMGIAGMGLNYNTTTGSFTGSITLERNLTLESKSTGRLNLAGPITGTGGLIFSGNIDANTFVLYPASSYTGDTLFRYGVFNVSNVVRKAQNGPLGFSTNAIRMGIALTDNPTLYIDDNGEVDRDFRVAAAVSAKIATRTATNLLVSASLVCLTNPVTIISADNLTNWITWTGGFSGTNMVQKSGLGTLVLSADNSGWLGGLNLENGTLKLNSATAAGNGRFRFVSYNTRLENGYGPLTLTNGVEFGRPVYFYGTNDLVFTGGKKINAGLASIDFTVDKINTLLGFRGNLTGVDVTCGLTKIGAGFLDWGGTNLASLFTNTLEIKGGVLRTLDGVAISTQSTIRLNGGVWESTGLCTRALGAAVGGGQLHWGNGASGGFSAFGGPFAIDLAGASTNLFLWASGAFVTNTAELWFGSVRADSAVTLKDRIDLNGASRSIRVTDNPASIADKAVLEGGIQGGAAQGITKAGTGVLVLGGANTYPGATAVNEGTLLVDGELDYQAAAAVQCKSNTWLGGRGTIRRPVTLDPGFAGFDWADAPGTLTVATNLSLPRGFTYKFRRSGALVPSVQVAGTLTVSNAVTVNVFGDIRTPLVLFSAGALAGTQNLTNWAVTGSSKVYTVKTQGTSVIATCPAAGTIMIVQ